MSNSATYLTLQEVADANGVSRQSIADWMKRRDIYCYPHRVVSGNRYLIHIGVAEAYAKGRLGVKTKGYVTLKGLCQDMGMVPSTYFG